jgi:hypothetical protein
VLTPAGVHHDAGSEIEDRNDLHRSRHDALMIPVIGLDVGGANTKGRSSTPRKGAARV